MKKLTVSLLSFLMIISLIGCGSDTETNATEPIASIEETEVPASVHVHSFAYESIGDSGHVMKCECGETNPKSFTHMYNENYECVVCGYKHEHTLSLKHDDKNDTHYDACDCGYKSEPVECTYEYNDNLATCSECNYEKTRWVVVDIESATKYAKSELNVRSIPDPSGELVETLKTNDKVTVVGEVKHFEGTECNFFKLDNGSYADGNYLSDTEVKVETKPATPPAAKSGTVEVYYHKPGTSAKDDYLHHTDTYTSIDAYMRTVTPNGWGPADYEANCEFVYGAYCVISGGSQHEEWAPTKYGVPVYKDCRNGWIYIFR